MVNFATLGADKSAPSSPQPAASPQPVAEAPAPAAAPPPPPPPPPAEAEPAAPRPLIFSEMEAANESEPEPIQESLPVRIGAEPSIPMTGAALATMWFAPRRTIRGVIDEGSFIMVLLLAALAGSAGVLIDGLTGPEAPLASELMASSLTFGPLLGIVRLLIGAVVLFLTGKLFAGHARFGDVCAALSWAQLPSAVGGILILSAILIVGPSLLAVGRSAEPVDATAALTVLGLGIATIVLGIWSAVLFVGAVAEAQCFSIRKTLGYLIVTGLITFVVAFVLILVLGATVLAAIGMASG